MPLALVDVYNAAFLEPNYCLSTAGSQYCQNKCRKFHNRIIYQLGLVFGVQGTRLSMAVLPWVIWSFSSSSRASASCPCAVAGSSSTDSRRHWIKRSRKSVPLLGSCATNLSTFSAWVTCSVNSSWKSAVIRRYLLRYGRRLGTSSSFRNLKWHFWRTLTLTETWLAERWNTF